MPAKAALPHPGEVAEQPAAEGDGGAMELDVLNSEDDDTSSGSSDESEESSSDESDEEGGAVVAAGAAGAPAAAPEPVSAEQRALTEVFVGGLDPDTKEADLEATFSAAGELAEARLPVSPQPSPALTPARSRFGSCGTGRRES